MGGDQKITEGLDTCAESTMQMINATNASARAPWTPPQQCLQQSAAESDEDACVMLCMGTERCDGAFNGDGAMIGLAMMRVTLPHAPSGLGFRV